MVAPIWKQWYIACCTFFVHFTTGIILGFPAILTPAITADDSSIRVTTEEASWIAAAYSVTGVAAYIIMPTLLQIYGRKFNNFFTNFANFIGSVIIALAPNFTCLIVGRIIQGISFSGLFISCLILAEYVHPKRRGYFICLKLSVFVLGILACHSLSVLLTWRQMSWLAAVPSILGAVSTLTWPESPSWLAYNERYDESATAFKWLRGDDSEARKEIRELIEAQKELRKLNFNSKNKKFCGLSVIFGRPEFLKPLFISSLLFIIMHAFGHHYLLAYIIEIMTKLTGDKLKGYYYTIAFDVMKIVSTILSSLVISIFKRRTIVFVTGATSCLALSLLCISNYFESRELLSVSWLTPLLLIAHNVIFNIGFLPVAIVIKAEIFPIQYKGLGAATVGIVGACSSIATVKLTATMLASLEAHGMFAVYLLISSVCLLLLYFILSETKDRTLQDIENDYFGVKLDDVDEETLVLEVKETKHETENSSSSCRPELLENFA